VFFVCRRVFGSGWFLPAAVGLLVLNPLILDYLSLARGYGLALGFFLAGMYQLVRYMEDFSGATNFAAGRKRLAIGAVCLALAVHSNLTFLIAGTSLTVMFLAIVVRNGRASFDLAAYAELLHSLRSDFVRPGLWVFGILATTWFKLRPSAFYFGEESLSASLRGMTEASLAHHRVTWPCDTGSPMFQSCTGIVATWGVGLVLLATTLAWGKVALRWINRRGSLDALGGTERFLLLSGGTLLLSCAVLFGSHFAFGMKYPHERTGLHLVAIFSLAGLTVLHKLLQSRKTALRLLKIPCLAIALLLLVQFTVELPATHYRQWRYDCTSREVFQAIADRASPSPSTPVRVVCQWWYLPSLNFYRTTRHAAWMELVDSRRGEEPCDFRVDSRRTSRANAGLTPIFESMESDVVVAVADADTRRR